MAEVDDFVSYYTLIESDNPYCKVEVCRVWSLSAITWSISQCLRLSPFQMLTSSLPYAYWYASTMSRAAVSDIDSYQNWTFAFCLLPGRVGVDCALPQRLWFSQHNSNSTSEGFRPAFTYTVQSLTQLSHQLCTVHLVLHLLRRSSGTPCRVSYRNGQYWQSTR